ncbi:MAG: class I SAM-dependent methyltransferase [Pseudolysinimonas sp.]
MDEPADFWEQRYASSDQVWSGRANQALVDVSSTLTPGRALDLGCGEGGDAVWLAQHGWDVTGVDISPSAIARGRAAADALGLGPERIRFIVSDLERRADAGPFDLVTACFLHSPVALSREQILRRAADQVAQDGHLLIVSHAAPPPWSNFAQHHPEPMPQPADELAALDLPTVRWEVEIAEVRVREATGPDGQHATLDDGVVLLRRR